MTENSKPEVVAYLAPAGEASMNNVDRVITEAEFARRLDVGGIIQDTVQEAYSVPLVRLFDYEALQADRDQLINALKRIISSHEANTGHEPSTSVFHRDIDDARHLLATIEGRKP